MNMSPETENLMKACVGSCQSSIETLPLKGTVQRLMKKIQCEEKWKSSTDEAENQILKSNLYTAKTVPAAPL